MAAIIFKQETTLEKYYQQVLTAIRHIPPFSMLRNQEIFILGWMMYYYNEIKKTIKEEKAINILLFTSYRSKLVEKLVLDDEDGKAYDKAYTKLNNILVSLRKKDFIIKEKNKDHLNKNFILDPDKMNKVEFIFKF